MSTVIFETELAGAEPTDGVIRRRGKVFAVGDFPDKGFSLTTEEAAAAVAAFEPVSANLSHHRTVADGRCGTLESVALQPDGSITGTFAEPKSFAQWLGDGARKLSLEWDKATERIVGVAHALNPRIPDAVVFEAVAAFERGESPKPLQIDEVPPPVAAFEFKEKPMEPTTNPPAKSAVELELEAAQAKIAAFEAKEAQRITDEARGRAVAFADDQVASKRILAKGNTDYLHAVALFASAEQFDAERPQLACFDDSFKPADVSLVAAVKAIFEKIPAHGMNTEAVTNVPAGTVALFEREKTQTNEPGNEPPTPARKAELLGLSSLGQAAKETK